MSMTYCMCQGMRGERTARGGSDGCIASVQSYDGSVCIANWYEGDTLMVKVGTSDRSSCYADGSVPSFIGTLEEFNNLLKLAKDIEAKKVSITRHREKSNRQLALERLGWVK